MLGGGGVPKAFTLPGKHWPLVGASVALLAVRMGGAHVL